jgi:hypothetical protein
MSLSVEATDNTDYKDLKKQYDNLLEKNQNDLIKIKQK